MRNTIVLFLTLVFSTPLFGIEIPNNCHVSNEKPGYCSWVSLEILGKVHGIKKLNRLVENRKKDSDKIVLKSGKLVVEPKNLGYNHAIREKLNNLGVRFWMQDAGLYSKSLLKYTTSHGCVVAVKKGAIPGYQRCHAIILTEYRKDGSVKFFNCNDPDKSWVATKEWFDYYWTGLIVVVEKSE